jgi:hypothetical protein
MGCALTKKASGAADGDQRIATSAADAQKRADESAKRIADMLAEIERERQEEKHAFDQQLAKNDEVVAALQRALYGIDFEFGVSVEDYLQAVMSVAAADGLDAPESQWLRDRTVLLGLDADQIERLFTLDLRFASVSHVFEAVLKSGVGGGGGGAADVGTPQIGRLIYYDAVTMAFADDMYSLDERVCAQRMADALGLSRAEVGEIESIVEAELAIRQSKGEILAAASSENASGSGIPSWLSQPPSSRRSHAAASGSGLHSFRKRREELQSTTIEEGEEVDEGGGAAKRLSRRSTRKSGVGDGAKKAIDEQAPRRKALQRLAYGANVPSLDVPAVREAHMTLLLAASGVPRLVVGAAEAATADAGVGGGAAPVLDDVKAAVSQWLRERALLLGTRGSGATAVNDDAVEAALVAAGSIPTVPTELNSGGGAAIAILFDAATMAAQLGDAYADAMMAQRGEWPSMLGVTEAISEEIVDVVAQELNLRDRKVALFVACSDDGGKGAGGEKNAHSKAKDGGWFKWA